MDTLRQDFRFAVRMLWKYRGLTTTSVLALALGVGLTSTMFSIVYGAFLKGLPFEEQEELLHLDRLRPTESRQPVGVSIHDYVDWRERQSSFEDLAAYRTSTINISGEGGLPERHIGAFVTANTFELLGIQPVVGRSFREGEDRVGAEPVALIGHRVWMNRYGGDPAVIGRPVLANGETLTLVGVMPERFEFPQIHDVWIPLRLDPVSQPRGQSPPLQVIGRLKDRVSLEQASVEMAAIARRLEQQYPETNHGLTVLVQPYIHRYFPYEQRAGLVTMLGAVFGVLLIACVNVANLLLARTVVRSREIAVRSALGAGRARLIRQMLVETLVLSALGSGLGLAVAYLGLEAFNRAIVDNPPPFWMEFRVDPAVAGFVLLLAALSALLSGIAPALRASGANVIDGLKEGSHGSASLRLGRLPRILVVTEIAVSCGLLVTSGLMIMSIVGLKSREFPFATEDIFKAHIALFESDYPDESNRRRFFDTLRARLDALPAAEGISISSGLPGLGGAPTRFSVESAAYATPEELPHAQWMAIDPGTFELYGVRIVTGRDFEVSDDSDSRPVTIVNESFAKKFFPGQSCLGRRIRRGSTEESEPWMTVVGVVPDTMTSGWHFEEAPEGFYVPLDQSPPGFATIAVHAAGSPLAMTTAVRDAVAAVDPNLPIYGASTLDFAIGQRTWFVDVFGSLFVIFGIAALLLASTGLYGVMAFDVNRRVPEFGLRMSFGASRFDLIRLILRQGLIQISIGMIAGMALGWGLSRLVEGIFYGVGAGEPSAYASIAFTMAAAGILATLVPARQAIRVEPATALRHE